MPAWTADGCTGVKIVHVNPANAGQRLPAVHAAYLLSSAVTGAPIALLDGGELTDRRTAATSVLAARHLGDPELWWRLADANGVTDPATLAEPVGRMLRVTLPADVPGGGDG